MTFTYTAARAQSNLTFSRGLRDLNHRFSDRPIRLGELLEAMQGRGFHLLLVFMPNQP